MNYSYLALSAIIFLQILDIITTVNIIRWDNGVELNKVTAWFIRKLGLVPGLLTIKVIATAPIAAFVYFGIAPLWSLLLVVAIMLWVVMHNAIEMRG